MKPTHSLAAVSITGLSLVLAGCGGSTGSTSSGSAGSSGDCAAKETFCVGLVTDAGKLDDKSFNQSAWQGVQAAAKSTGARTKSIQPTGEKEFASSIEQFAKAKYDVIVTVGDKIAKDTTAEAKKYPDVKFIGVDQNQAATTANLTGLVFPEDQAGYAAGYLAGSMTKKNTVSAVLGQQIAPVEKYYEGYAAGAKKANSKVKVEKVYHPADSNAFTDPVWGGNAAKQQVAQGSDVVFAAGGGTGNGALGQVAKDPAAGSATFCIGVDSDQYNTVPEARKCLLTSATKDIENGVSGLITKAKNGSIKGGDFTGTVGLAPFHGAKVPADVQAKVAKVVAGLKSGSVKTGVKVG